MHMTLPYPARIALLILAAIIGGYVFTSAAMIFFSAILPMSRTGGLVMTALLSFVVYCAAIIWVFAVRDVGRAWLGLLLPSIPMLVIGIWLTETV